MACDIGKCWRPLGFNVLSISHSVACQILRWFFPQQNWKLWTKKGIFYKPMPRNKRWTLRMYSVKALLLIVIDAQKDQSCYLFYSLESSFYCHLYCVIRKEIVPFMSHCIALSVLYVLPRRFGDVFVRVDQALSKRFVFSFAFNFAQSNSTQSPFNPQFKMEGAKF